MKDSDDFGHVKISRKTFESDPWWFERRELSKWEAWVDVMQLAAWRGGPYRTDFGVIPLKRGEFVASLRWLAARWHWTIKRVRNWIATAEKWARLTAQRETDAGTIYLIVNYDAYQSKGHSKGTPKGTAEGTEGAQQGHKIEAGKAVKHKTLTTLSNSTDESADDQLGLDVKVPSDVQVVLDHYLVTHPRRRIGPKDRKAVAKALTLGYASNELIEAIDGNASDDWHVEKHKHELSYVLRDNGKIDDFRERAAGANGRVAVDPETGLLNEVGMAVLNGNGRHP